MEERFAAREAMGFINCRSITPDGEFVPNPRGAGLWLGIGIGKGNGFGAGRGLQDGQGFKRGFGNRFGNGLGMFGNSINSQINITR
ncbi:hypothetical protein M1M92_02100 [Peptococcaceae bacterium]|jgi:hypothetical protein|nr:hypothetical protein [Peptococcaceae bacterium]MCL0052265.1 hypothetical protein [Peptococcaceae bacterium]MCL0077760.1 hypothetical protein [Peptococcaceae bacterium]